MEELWTRTADTGEAGETAGTERKAGSRARETARKAERRVEWERIPFTDDRMFAYVMRRADICGDFLHRLLDGVPDADVRGLLHGVGAVQVGEPGEDGETVSVQLAQPQKRIGHVPGKHDVVLDVYVCTDRAEFNMEMQQRPVDGLAQRIRLYGAHMDVEQLQRGARYADLKPHCVIFICRFDAFGKDRYCYSFQYREESDRELKLGDGSYKLLFYTGGHKGEIGEDLKALLAYMDDPVRYRETVAAGADGEAANRAKEDSLIRRIENMMRVAREDAEWRRQYMTYECKLDEREMIGEARGKAIGEAHGKTLGIKIAQRDFARKLLQQKMSAEFILSVSGLTEQELAQLMQEAQQ